MSRRRKSIFCPYCKNSFAPSVAHKRYCSLKCKFWNKVKKLGPDDCWDYIAGIGQKGYGNFKHQGRTISAHRMAWMLTYGPIPDNVSVLHKCDNPPCCNPKHFFLGTPLDNRQDCIRKNRQKSVKGESHGMAKLTEKDILEIRSKLAIGFRICDLAIAYKVCWANIHCIKYRKSWSHI